MKNLTIQQLKENVKNELVKNNLGYTNDGSIYDRVNQAIQWAWDNWEADILSTFYEGEKPESYTYDFMVDWVDNEDLYDELEAMNSN